MAAISLTKSLSDLKITDNNYVKNFIDKHKKIKTFLVDAALTVEDQVLNYQYTDPVASMAHAIRYKTEDVLGKGGSATVYRGTFDGKTCAVKISQRSVFEDTKLLEKQYLSEATLSCMNHPNIVQVYSLAFFVTSTTHITYGLAFETIEKPLPSLKSCELFDLIKSECLSHPQIRSIARDVALGLNVLHDCEIAHRDLTVQNILIQQREGTSDSKDPNYFLAKIGDCGLAYSMAEGAMTVPWLGTPGSIAPELYGASIYPKQLFNADIFAFGALIYSCFFNSAILESVDYTTFRINSYEYKTRIRWRLAQCQNGKLVNGHDAPQEARELIVGALSLAPEKRPTTAKLLESTWLKKTDEKPMDEMGLEKTKEFEFTPKKEASLKRATSTSSHKE